MDIDTTLAVLRQWVTFPASERDGYAVDDILELFDALDKWITNGGYLPSAWEDVNNARG